MKKQLNLRDAIHSFSFLSFHWKETNLKSLMRVKTYAFCDIFSFMDSCLILGQMEIQLNNKKMMLHQ